MNTQTTITPDRYATNIARAKAMHEASLYRGYEIKPETVLVEQQARHGFAVYDAGEARCAFMDTEEGALNWVDARKRELRAVVRS